jgi:hypothetical protein
MQGILTVYYEVMSVEETDHHRIYTPLTLAVGQGQGRYGFHSVKKIVRSIIMGTHHCLLTLFDIVAIQEGSLFVAIL